MIDQIYSLTPGSYSGGLSLAFGIPDGPLQPGQYRFRITPSLRDRFGNALPVPLDQFFVIAPTPPFTVENRANNAAAGATPLALNESPTGLRTGFGRGKLFDNTDVDYWSFSAQAGDILSFATEVPGQPGASELHYEVLNPNGVRILNYYPGYYGTGQAEPVALTTNGVYLVRITPNYGFYSEHHFRVSLAGAPMQVESEGNDILANADALTLAVSGD